MLEVRYELVNEFSSAEAFKLSEGLTVQRRSCLNTGRWRGFGFGSCTAGQNVLERVEEGRRPDRFDQKTSHSGPQALGLRLFTFICRQCEKRNPLVLRRSEPVKLSSFDAA